jgi:starch phosphorylase
MHRVGGLPGSVHGALYRADVTGDRPASDYTPRVIPARPDVRVPIEASLIAWYH